MYSCVGDLWTNVYEVARCKNNAVEQGIVQRICRTCYAEICAMTSWIALRRSASFSMAQAVDSTGYWLPGDLLGIDSVRGDDNNGRREYILRDQSGLDFEEGTFRYYFSDMTTDPLVFGDDLQLTNGASSFTSVSLGAADHTGQYIKFGTEPGIYLLTGPLAFTPQYNGPDLTDEDYQIRPQGTRKFSVVDPSGAFDSKAVVNVFYWRLPPPLYRASDLILLPSSRPLELMTLIRFIGQQRKNEMDAGVHRSELTGQDGKSGVVQSMIQSNPSFPQSRGARDSKNNRITYGGDMFGRRGGGGVGSQYGSVQNDSWESWANKG